MRRVSYFLSLARGCLLAMLFAVAGCPSFRRAEARRWALCTCEYLTDMDYPGKLKLEACGETCTCEPEGELCRDADMCRTAGEP